MKKSILAFVLLSAWKLIAAPAVCTFTASGIWTCPPGVTSVQVECWGGGGAGGAALAGAGGLAGGGGGGGGAYAISSTVAVTPSHSYNVTVGAGGTSSGGASTAGSASTFTGDSATVTANGGSVGTSESSNGSFGAGGAGGAANGSGISFAGGNGATAVSGVGGGGGGSSAGPGVAGSYGGVSPAAATIGGGTVLGGGTGGSGSSSSADGGLGFFPGGGGAGAYSKSATQRNGGAGGGGQVAITVATPYAFTPGNLAVLQPADASANNTTLTILEVNSNAANQAYAYATLISGTNSTGLRFSGSAGTSGDLADSADGTLLAVTGANSTNAVTAVNAIAARGVGTLNAADDYALQATYTASVSPTTQPRGASTIDDVNWVFGDQGGIYTNNSTSASPAGNFKAVKSFGGSNYLLTASATVPAVMTYAAGMTNYLPGVQADANATDFYLVSSGASGTSYDVLYVIDNTSTTSGTIYKYSLIGGTWTAEGTYDTGLGGYGLCAATNDSDGFNLFFTTGNGSTESNSVVEITDTASPLNSTMNVAPGSGITLYTTAAGALLKGIAFVPVATAPLVASSAATLIGTTNATLNGAVTYDGGAALTSYGFYWSASPPVTTASTRLQVGATDFSGSYSTNITGLSVNTIYYYRAYATNSAGNSLGHADVSFYTLANSPTAPTVNGPTTTSLNVTIGSGDGNPAITTCAIEETTSGKFVQANGSLGAAAVFQTASVWGTETVTGLNPDTTYTFEVEAQNGANVATPFGPAVNGTTSAPPTPTISVVPNSLTFPPTITNGTSANLNYTVSAINLTQNITITAPANFQISTSSGSGFGSSVTLTESGGTVADTAIYVRFQPTAQTAYSATITHVSSGANNPNVGVSGIGAFPPSVTTQVANPTNATSATLNGTVTATNGASILDTGFYWSTAPGVNTATGTQLSEGGTTLGAYSKVLAGLNANTIYYYRAYASNSVGLTLGSADVSFYTLANTPAAPVVSNPTTNSLAVAIGSGDNNPPATTYAIQETNSGNYVQANGSLGAPVVFQTASVWGAKTVTGLNLGASYAFDAVADNALGISSAFGPATIASTANGPFTLGDLAALLADNASANNSAFSIVELNPTNTTGVAVQTIPINGTNGPTALRVSGSAGSAPKLADSGDGTLLVMATFNSTNSSVTANTITNRAVATLDVSANYVLRTTYVGISGNQVRNAATVDNNTWYIGDAGGIYTNGTTSPVNTANIGAIKSFGGVVYVLQSSKNTVPVSSVSADATTLTALPGFTARDSAAVDFYLVASGNNGSTCDILYTLDETSATAGAINKYFLSSGTWTLSGTYVTTFGGYGLLAALNGAGGLNLYVTTGDGTVAGNSVYELTDDSAWNAGPNITTQNLLYTAPGAATLKGIAFAPTKAAALTRILPGNPTTVTATGFPYRSYLTERSTDLMNWVNISTNSAAANGMITNMDYFYDLGDVQPPAACYRLLW